MIISLKTFRSHSELVKCLTVSHMDSYIHSHVSFQRVQSRTFPNWGNPRMFSHNLEIQYYPLAVLRHKAPALCWPIDGLATQNIPRD